MSSLIKTKQFIHANYTHPSHAFHTQDLTICMNQPLTYQLYITPSYLPCDLGSCVTVSECINRHQFSFEFKSKGENNIFHGHQRHALVAPKPWAPEPFA